MSASTSPDQPTPVTLRIHADNPAAEVFLLDPQMQLTARGVGSLVTRQIPGVYKIRVRVGRESEDRLILLAGDTTETIKAPMFASPAPLETTTLTHEYHVAAAETHSARPTVTLGDGASIFVLVRYFTPPGHPARPQGHPARDLTLRHLDRRLVVDLGTQSVTGTPPDAWAACHVRLAPGPYALECQTSQGPLAGTVIASPGWQTQVFLVRSQPTDDPDAGGAAAATIGLEMGTVLMGRGSFRSASADLRLIELARIALADERPILGESLRDLLLQKFTNPMQGILGAHLMLLARDRAAAPARRPDPARRPAAPDPEQPFDPRLFDEVVANLRSLVGPAHPDVEALSLQCTSPALRYTGVFTVPPMLRRSWVLIVEASNERPHVLDSVLWERVMTRTMTAPYLSWLVAPESARTQLRDWMREVVSTRRKMPRRRAPEDTARGIALESAAPPDAAPPTEEFRRRLSLDLEIPRGVVDRMLGGQ